MQLVVGYVNLKHAFCCKGRFIMLPFSSRSKKSGVGREILPQRKNEGVLQSTYGLFPKQMFFSSASLTQSMQVRALFSGWQFSFCVPVQLFALVPSLEITSVPIAQHLCFKSEICLCPELLPEDQMCIFPFFLPFSFVMLRKDTFKGFLLCFLFSPWRKTWNNNSQIKTLHSKRAQISQWVPQSTGGAAVFLACIILTACCPS